MMKIQKSICAIFKKVTFYSKIGLTFDLSSTFLEMSESSHEDIEIFHFENCPSIIIYYVNDFIHCAVAE